MNSTDQITSYNAMEIQEGQEIELMDPPAYQPIVYLAGKMTGLAYPTMKEWRVSATAKLKKAGFRVIDPTDLLDRREFAKTIAFSRDMAAYNVAASEVIDANVYHMKRADIILAEFSFPEVSLGTIGEVIVANRELHKPVIAWGDNDAVCHAWVRGHLTAHRLGLSDAIDFIIDMYRG